MFCDPCCCCWAEGETLSSPAKLFLVDCVEDKLALSPVDLFFDG